MSDMDCSPTPTEKPCDEHGFSPWFNCPECGGRRAEPDSDCSPTQTENECENPACRNGSVSTYWGTLVHPMYGSMKINGEHDDPRIDCPGAQFYGGSGHQACGCGKNGTWKR